MDNKLNRIRELIDLKEKTDAELAELIGGVERPKRKWTRRNGKEDGSETQTPVSPEPLS